MSLLLILEQRQVISLSASVINMTITAVFQLLGVIAAWLTPIISGIIFVVQLKGDIKLLTREIENIKEAHKNSIQGLVQFNEATKDQVEQYKAHVDRKFDALSDKFDRGIERLFDELKTKADK